MVRGVATPGPAWAQAQEIIAGARVASLVIAAPGNSGARQGAPVINTH